MDRPRAPRAAGEASRHAAAEEAETGEDDCAEPRHRPEEVGPRLADGDEQRDLHYTADENRVPVDHARRSGSARMYAVIRAIEWTRVGFHARADRQLSPVQYDRGSPRTFSPK